MKTYEDLREKIEIKGGYHGKLIILMHFDDNKINYNDYLKEIGSGRIKFRHHIWSEIDGVPILYLDKFEIDEESYIKPGYFVIIGIR